MPSLEYHYIFLGKSVIPAMPFYFLVKLMSGQTWFSSSWEDFYICYSGQDYNKHLVDIAYLYNMYTKSSILYIAGIRLLLIAINGVPVI